MQYLDGGLPVRELGHQDGQVQVGYKQGKVSNTLMVAFLSGNLAIRMDRLEVQVAAAPTPFKRKNVV